MPNEPSSILTQDLREQAEAFGYRYTVFEPDGSEDDDRSAQFRGAVGYRSLPCGPKVVASDLVALRNSDHVGVMTRSLTVTILLEGVGADARVGSNLPMQIDPGCAAMVSLSDSEQLVGTCLEGQRSRTLLVQVRPEDLPDEDLAERVERILKRTEITPLHMPPRTMALANELFAPGLSGDIERLLAESCALELLARGLKSSEESQNGSAFKLSKADRARMTMVRDLLLAEPERSHRLTDLAREVGVSVTNLKQNFATVTGKTVFEFLREVRLDRAYAGLEKEDWTVSQAAYYVGYEYQGNFSRAFQREFGVRPSTVRRHGRRPS